jgi:3-oxoacyl-[acyl-carrier protein] reductase
MTPVQLHNKTAIVTGGGRSIGREVARALASRGARVMVNSNDYAELRETVALINDAGGEADMYAGEQSDYEAMSGLASMTNERFGGIDIVVLCGRIHGSRARLEDYPFEDWLEVLNVNLNGPFALCQAVMPIMRERGGGSIIFLSSEKGRKGQAQWGAYSSSMFGIEGLCQSLAEEGSDDGIRVNCINPGPTQVGGGVGPDSEILPAPEEIIPAFLFLACDTSKEVSGQSLDANDWIGKDL